MGRIKDLMGQVFVRLTVLRQDGYYVLDGKKRTAKWLCICECGNEVSVVGTSLTKGVTRSCGCLRDELRTKHNLRKTRQYAIWTQMKQRVSNPNITRAVQYNLKGIGCDPKWQNFEGFWEDREEGLVWYRSEREKAIKSVADEYKDQLDKRVYDALYSWKVG